MCIRDRIKIVPPSDLGPLTTAVTQTTQFDWIVFTSVNAVDAFMEAFLTDGRDIRALVGPRLCAVGTELQLDSVRLRYMSI